MPRAGSSTGPRCVALVGPFQSGKTTLLEAILARTGAIQRQGSVDAGTTVGDASKEARHHKMSVEVSVATTTFMDDSYTFIDCPGSVEFVHDMRAGAAGGRCRGGGLRGRREESAAAPAHPARAGRPENSALPVSQQDRQGRHARARDHQAAAAGLARAAAAASDSDLARRASSPASSISRWSAPMSTRSTHRPKSSRSTAKISTASKEARFTMLETLADHDDELMEQLLEDIPPPRDKVFDDLAKEQRDGLICPVLMGVATRTNGVLRLLKALRHEVDRRDGDRAAARRQGQRRSPRLCGQDA